MVGNLADLALLLSLGGTLGALAGIYAAGKRFADHLNDLATTVEAVLKDPRQADLSTVVAKARTVAADARSLLGMIKQVVRA